MPTLGDNIRRLRVAAGFATQVELADALGTKSQMISDWENRREALDMGNLVKLAVTLKVTVDVLIEGVYPDYDKMRADLSGHTGTKQSPPGSQGVHDDATARLLAAARDEGRRDALGEAERTVKAFAAQISKLAGKAPIAEKHTTDRRGARRSGGR